MLQNDNQYTYGNLQVSIERDNLVEITNVDAIVNAANTYLCSGGGVCGAVFSACGYSQLRKECEKYLKTIKKDQIKTGDCAVTSSCKMKEKNGVQFIFHSPGPVYDSSNKQESIELLKLTVENILKQAVEKNIKSVAIPAISSGIFGFPKRLCAKTFKEVLMNNQIEQNLIVRLVNIDYDTTEVFENVFKDIKQIVFVPNIETKAYTQSCLVVPVECLHQPDQANSFLIDIENSLLKNEKEEIIENIKNEIEKQNNNLKQQNFLLFQDKISTLREFHYLHGLFVAVIQYKKLTFDENLLRLVEIFDKIMLEDFKLVGLISIPLMELAQMIFQESDITKLDQQLIIKQFLTTYYTRERRNKRHPLAINLIVTKEVQEEFEKLMIQQLEEQTD